MKIRSLNSFVPGVLGAASIALVSSPFIAPAPANAYEVYLNGKTAGDPSGSLYNVTLNSTNDLGRTLDPFTWYVPAGTTNTSGETTPVALSALLTMTVKEFTSNLLTLSINVTNTTQVRSGENASIVALGFGIDPNATSVAISNSSIFDTAILQNGQQQFAGGFKQIDICIFADGCKGGDVKNGLQAGQSTSFDLTISSNFWNSFMGTNFVTLSDFPLKFQTTHGSFEPAGVPEPITVFGSGLALGFGALFKRQMAKRDKRAAVKS